MQMTFATESSTHRVLMEVKLDIVAVKGTGFTYSNVQGD